MDAKTGSTLPLSTRPNLESPIVWSPTGRQLFVSESDRVLAERFTEVMPEVDAEALCCALQN